MAYAASVSLSIEMLQVMLPPHIADVTDVLLCTLGAWLGVLVTWKIAFAADEAVLKSAKTTPTRTAREQESQSAP